MVKQSRSEWKAGYFKRLGKHLADYEKCFIVGVDNVRSKQMQQIRHSLRGEAEVVMGKNTMMRKVITQAKDRDERVDKLLPHVHENIGFVFTKGDLNDIREQILANRVEAPAKAGTIAQCDVIVPGQNTGLGPEKTSFFQALNIPTKITRGTIEIMSDVHLIHKDTKVGQSEAALLGMLKINPFTYGLVIRQVYDQGSVYDPAVLDITPDVIMAKLQMAARNVAAVSLALGYPTAASLPHIAVGAMRNILSIAIETDYSFPAADRLKEYLKDPSKFASSVAPTAAAGKAAPVAEEAPQPSDDDSESMNLDLFG